MQKLNLEFFFGLAKKYRDDVIKYHAVEIPTSLKFFKNNASSNIFKDGKSFYCRFQVFYDLETLKSAVVTASVEHPEISPNLVKMIDECLLLQPIQDRLLSGLIDIGEWLLANKAKLSGANNINEEVSRDDFLLLHEAWEDIYRVPYSKPSNETYDYFENLIRDRQTSSDTFAHLIKAAYENVERFTALQHKLDGEDILINKDVKTMKMKAEELIRIINDNVSDVEISHTMLRNIYELLVESLATYDPDPISGLHDACQSLKRSLVKTGERTVKKFPEPPKITFEAKHSSLLQALEQKGKKELDKLNGKIPQVIPATNAFDKLIHSDSELSFGQIAQEIEEYQKGDVPGDFLLEILGRLKNLKSQSYQNDGILCGDYPGKFHLISSHFLWLGIPKELYHLANELNMHGIAELAISIPFSSIEKFIIETLPIEYDYTAPSSRVPSSVNLSHRSSPLPPSFLGSAPSSRGTTKDDQAPRTLYYISIYTSNEVYKFFPFVEKETKFFKEALLECAGIRPSFQDHFVRQLLTEKIINERREILEELMAEPGYPWLDSSASLSKCISCLTDERKRPSPKDLERLFHSCRLEKAVANETIVQLQNFWQVAALETVKHSLLRIADRLIDPQVMQKSDSAFIVLHAWLKGQEQIINPYKSPTLVMLVSRLLKRCKSVSMDQLTPLVLSHSKSTFEKYELYSKWSKASSCQS